MEIPGIQVPRLKLQMGFPYNKTHGTCAETSEALWVQGEKWKLPTPKWDSFQALMFMAQVSMCVVQGSAVDVNLFQDPPAPDP